MDTSAAAFLLGHFPMSDCTLVVVRDWDSETPILLCSSPSHTTAMHVADVKRRLPEVGQFLEFNAAELDVLASILPLISGEQRRHLRHRILDLKRSFGGRVISEAQFRAAAASAEAAGSGPSSKDASPRRTTSRNGARAAAASGRSTSPTLSGGFAALLRPRSPARSSPTSSSDSAGASTDSSSSDGLPW